MREIKDNAGLNYLERYKIVKLHLKDYWTEIVGQNIFRLFGILA